MEGEITEYIIIVLCCVAIVCSLATLLTVLKTKKTEKNDDSAAAVRELAERLRITENNLVTLSNNINYTHSVVTQSVNNAIDSFNKSGNLQNETVQRFLQSLKADIMNRLEEMMRTNKEKLSEMQRVVDEKLTESIENRISLAFKGMNDRLDAVQKNFAEVQSLSKEVVRLNGVFTNVKNRGAFGEVSLDTILTEILAPEQYFKQFAIKKNSREAVDFAVRLPGQGGCEVYLPIDSKFPLADYERLTEAYDTGNGVETARIALLKAVKIQAKSICEKYIEPPCTTDFAVMFLPTEGLFAEIARKAGFMDELRRECKVIPCGPTTVSALLNSLMVGFNTLKIQKKSAEIVGMMKGFGKDFDKLLDLIARVRKSSENITGALDLIDKRNSAIRKSLDKMELVSGEEDESDALQGDAAETLTGTQLGFGSPNLIGEDDGDSQLGA